ncbi:MAG: FAD-binding oxidoreductase [Betaproteobacteria bacterium]|nr:FAD-binding oxidoreductase [Betaproteobacteria bacterium]
MTVPAKCDVAIAGGGIMGLSAAYFLKTLSPGIDVAIVERDPTYEFCSTPRASGGCRIQFSCPENIRMSLFSIDFIRDFPKTMRTATQESPIDWVEGGYLFIVPPEHIGLLEANHAEQVKAGGVAHLLDPAGIKARWPSMNVDDLGAAVHTPHDGWCDPSGMLQGFKRKCIELGVRYVHDEVAALEVQGTAVRSAPLKSGASISADHFVNAAGAWSALVGEMAGMKIPVSPLRRFEHYFTCGNPMDRLPYVKDLARMAFRSEGAGFSGGVVDGDEPRGFNFEVDHGYFERVVWPAAAHRFPALESAKCHRTWSGLYEQCELDGNPIIGNWPGRLDNFHVCTGFSGHGMMHAPAAGRAVAERILYSEYRTIDLSRLGYGRVVANAPYAERGIL